VGRSGTLPLVSARADVCHVGYFVRHLGFGLCHAGFQFNILSGQSSVDLEDAQRVWARFQAF